MKAKVQWTFAPLNGLVTDGEPWTCKREQGERSAASRTSAPGTGDLQGCRKVEQRRSSCRDARMPRAQGCAEAADTLVCRPCN